MIRQAINCDMCGAEKQAVTSHWFVAYEHGGELKLRGWESPKQSRKDVKHLCGQKCVQRLTANFTAAVMSIGHGIDSAKDVVPASAEKNALLTQGQITHGQVVQSPAAHDHDDTPILERMGYDRETAKSIEAESWAGPVKPKEPTWGAPRQKIEPESFLTARLKSHPSTRLPHSA